MADTTRVDPNDRSKAANPLAYASDYAYAKTLLQNKSGIPTQYSGRPGVVDAMSDFMMSQGPGTDAWNISFMQTMNQLTQGTPPDKLTDSKYPGAQAAIAQWNSGGGTSLPTKALPGGTAVATDNGESNPNSGLSAYVQSVTQYPVASGAGALVGFVLAKHVSDNTLLRIAGALAGAYVGWVVVNKNQPMMPGIVAP